MVNNGKFSFITENDNKDNQKKIDWNNIPTSFIKDSIIPKEYIIEQNEVIIGRNIQLLDVVKKEKDLTNILQLIKENNITFEGIDIILDKPIGSFQEGLQSYKKAEKLQLQSAHHDAMLQMANNWLLHVMMYSGCTMSFHNYSVKHHELAINFANKNRK